jgi:hypothetical protein
MPEGCVRAYHLQLEGHGKEGNMITLQKPVISELTSLTEVNQQVMKGKIAILSVLERAAEEADFKAKMAENPSEALSEYYILSPEEKATLASGDIQKIEKWVGKLEPKLTEWLWARLAQEKW